MEEEQTNDSVENNANTAVLSSSPDMMNISNEYF